MMRVHKNLTYIYTSTHSTFVRTYAPLLLTGVVIVDGRISTARTGTGDTTALLLLLLLLGSAMIADMLLLIGYKLLLQSVLLFVQLSSKGAPPSTSS